LLRIADVLLALDPVPEVVLTGGEPLLVSGLLELCERLRRGGAKLTLYTSGYGLDAPTAARLGELLDRIGVSVDGPDAPLNDFLRERAGAFDKAMAALRLLAGSEAHVGIEVTVTKSNFHVLDPFATDVAPRFDELGFLHFGALIPTGLASRESYVERELLSDSQMAQLPSLQPRLQKLAPKTVTVRVADNLPFRMSEEQVARGQAFDMILKIEADGRARAMDIYEGTVGHMLDEPFAALWHRALGRAHHPFVRDALGRVGSMRDWAEACRAIDLYFAAPEDRQRIRAREVARELPPELLVRRS
jgi:MoaA/NifB/PqqE/SkfB family radical SAM enzyme